MRKLALAAALLLAAASALAQPAPRITNATVTRTAASGDLAAQVRGARTAWVGYAVPAVDGYRVMCCFDTWGEFKRGGTCRLDNEASNFTNVDKDDDLRPAAGHVAIFYHFTNGTIDKVRTYSLDCTLDGTGTSVTWIDGADARRSVALLASLVGDDERMGNKALAALAMHAESTAGDRLDAWAKSPSASDKVRGNAIFWLAETRPERGFETARQMLRDASASRKVREKTVFALSLMKTPAATDEIIRVARNDADSHVRGQAIFWLSQAAGKKAAGAIRDALENDDDSHVRDKAVFAMSQLPDDEGIPILIELMKTHRDPRVRKKAAFWLGQKKDPRALNALEEILRR
jgi:HEAT repeats